MPPARRRVISRHAICQLLALPGNADFPATFTVCRLIFAADDDIE